ncbi:MAG: helix-turn-helix domain containing protein, partial [Candidatus Omnitrophica bacterium]|nr:helix-turn-helix domain containing protein [Candidatus Omnitrophota bacterium]
MKQSKDKKPLRYQMAQKALEIGVKPTARMFHSSPSVVRVWRDRFKTEGYSGLADRSRKPHHSPRETPQYIKEHIIALKSKYKRLGAEQVRILESLPQAPKTMRKIWRDAGIPSRKRPKKHVTKNNLRAIKKLFQLFEQSMEDTKDLMDIPEYYLQAKMLNLPKVQYTFREVSCGILFLGFANNISLTHAQLFAVYINHFLKKFKALPEKSMRQTDNGSEYIGSWNAKNPSAYTRSIESLPGQWHNTIFPGAHRMQSDVETIHNLMETEFYEIELFENRKDFLNKATTYQLFFNLHRPNSYKEHKTPLQLVQEKKPDLDQRLLMIPPVDLDKLLNWKISLIQGGKDLLTVP